MMKFTKQHYQILDRHYIKIAFFGYVFRIWNTSPKKVLEHLMELKVNQIKSTDYIKGGLVTGNSFVNNINRLTITSCFICKKVLKCEPPGVSIDERVICEKCRKNRL